MHTVCICTRAFIYTLRGCVQVAPTEFCDMPCTLCSFSNSLVFGHTHTHIYIYMPLCALRQHTWHCTLQALVWLRGWHLQRGSDWDSPVRSECSMWFVSLFGLQEIKQWSHLVFTSLCKLRSLQASCSFRHYFEGPEEDFMQQHVFEHGFLTLWRIGWYLGCHMLQ